MVRRQLRDRHACLPAPWSARAQHGRSDSDSDSETFGIRRVDSYLSPPGTAAYNGSRWIAINGKPIKLQFLDPSKLPDAPTYVAVGGPKAIEYGCKVADHIKAFMEK